jgi:hypothetical protein
MPEAKDCAFEKTMDRLPLEIFRDIIELLKAQLKPEQLWKLRIVSRRYFPCENTPWIIAD